MTEVPLLMPLLFVAFKLLEMLAFALEMPLCSSDIV